jgi:hypothetical protein
MGERTQAIIPTPSLSQIEWTFPAETSYKCVYDQESKITIMGMGSIGKTALFQCFAAQFVKTEISLMSLQPPRQSLGINTFHEFSHYEISHYKISQCEIVYKEEINALTNEIAQRVFDKMCQEILKEDYLLYFALNSKDDLSERELEKYLRIYTRQVVQRWYKHHKFLCKRRSFGISYVSLAKRRHRSGHWPRSSISRKSSDSSDSSNAAKTGYTFYADIKEFEEFLCKKVPSNIILRKIKKSHTRSK